jgi:hypothetical protein
LTFLELANVETASVSDNLSGNLRRPTLRVNQTSVI